MERRERITQLQQELSKTFQQARAIQQEIGLLWEQELAPSAEVELPVTKSAVVGYLSLEQQISRSIKKEVVRDE